MSREIILAVDVKTILAAEGPGQSSLTEPMIRDLQNIVENGEIV